MHLAGPECQRNVHQCLDARERLADIARLEDGNAGDGSILLNTVRSILLPWLLPGKRQVNIEFTWQAPNVEQTRHRAFHDLPAGASSHLPPPTNQEPIMTSHRFTRRGFLQTAAAGAAVPYVITSTPWAGPTSRPPARA